MSRKDINLQYEKTRAIYFHNMAGDSRSLELLLNTCYNIGIIPGIASSGKSKEKLAYIMLQFEKKHLNTIGNLIDLVIEIPNTEFNIKSRKDELFVELSCESLDSEQLFTRIKEIIEEGVFEKTKKYNYTLMSTIYNIAKILKEVTSADILFATDEKLFGQGKCVLSIYKDNQIDKINTKKTDKIEDVIFKLKTKSALHLPTVFFCTFEELRNFYFELDEIVYSKDIEGDKIGQ